MSESIPFQLPAAPCTQVIRSKSAPYLHQSPKQPDTTMMVSTPRPTRRRARSTTVTNRTTFRNETEGKMRKLTNPPVWNVRDEMLRSVPRFYPFSKSSITIVGESANTLARRISEFFRNNSIFAKYGNGDASVEATTRQHLRFGVTMWKKRKTTASRGGIIVEVQKLRGDSLEFHDLCGDLFKAVKAEPQVSDVSRRNRRNSLNTRFELGHVRCVAQHEEPSNETASEASIGSLSVGLRMLESHRVDSRQLGLEYMCFLTNFATVFRADASYVSHALLFGEERIGLRLRESVIRYIAKAERPNVQDEEDEGLVDDPKSIATMRSLALQALANALTVAAAEGTLEAEFFTLPKFWSDLVGKLVDVLGEASASPNDATLSAVSLRFLIQNLVGDTWQDVKREILPSLVEAYKFGKERYQALEVESLNLLEVMGLDGGFLVGATE